MRDVSAVAPGLPPLEGSVAACLASMLELDPADVPLPVPGHPEPWTVWRNWLGGRGLGLVPVRDPAGFGWPGPWLALLRSRTGSGRVAAVAFGVPPGLVWSPLGGPETFQDVEAGFVVAPADATRWVRVARTSARSAGIVEALALAPGAGSPMVLVDRAEARPGRGLEGDRYFDGRGTFSDPHACGIDLTLIEAEALEGMPIASGSLAPAEARRNVVTRGIDLDALVGRPFSVGAVACLGQRLCQPCAHLQRLTRPGTLRALVDRGGLRADVLTAGTIRVGDDVRT